MTGQIKYIHDGRGIFEGEVFVLWFLGGGGRGRSELGTHKAVTARFWPWLEPFSVRTSLKLCKLFPPARTLIPGRRPRDAGLLHILNASFYYFALLKLFLPGIRAKLTALWGV